MVYCGRNRRVEQQLRQTFAHTLGWTFFSISIGSSDVDPIMNDADRKVGMPFVEVADGLGSSPQYMLRMTARACHR